jgi:DNA repair exonuclease SbcCD ATPase subunit
LDKELLKIRPDDMKREIEEFKSKITLTELDLKQVKVVEPSEYYHEDKHDNVKDLLSEEKVKLGTMESKISDITEELKDFEGGFSCQYCGIELAKSDYADKKKEESNELNEKVGVSTKEVERLTKEEQSFVDLKKAFDLYERNKLIKEKFEIQLESLKLKKDQAQDKLDRFNKDKEKFEENKKIDETILRADMRLDDLQREKEGVNYEITNSEANIKKYEEKIEDFKELIQKIKEEESKLKIYKIYLELFGKKGISKMIMRSMMPVINSELQRLLVDSAEFKLEVRISDKDEVEFWMIDNNTGIEKLMSSGSGFERTMASLALRAVLSKVCSLPKPNIVVFDEVFGKISNDNLEMVAEFFHKIKDYFEKILIITHNPMVSQWADGIVKIEKTNNVSQVVQ